MDDLAIIIPFRGGDSCREQSFNFVCEYWSDLGNIYIGNESDEFGNFSRSRSRNVAVEASMEDLLLIVDADVVSDDRTHVLFACAIMSSFPEDWYIPYEWYVKLNERASQQVRQNIYSSTDVNPNDWEAPIHKGSRASLNLVTREQFYTVRGFDERFIGWSAEDQSFTDSLQALYGEPQRTLGTAFHLWHPTSYQEREGHNHYPAGMALWDRYKRAMGSKEEMMKIIQEKRELN